MANMKRKRSESPSKQGEKDFQNTIDMKTMYLNDKTADFNFVFTVDGEKTLVPVDKAILAGSSPVFHTMFFGENKDTDYTVGASVEGFKDFLTIFYLDKVKITKQNVVEFVKLADKYKVVRGLSMCEEFLLENTKIDELRSHLELAITLNLDNLKRFCEEGIRENVTDIFESNGFTKTDSKVLNDILQLNNHNCTANDVFKACIRWAEKACERNSDDATDKKNLRSMLGDCFYLIPFTAMELVEFTEVTLAYKGMFEANESLDMMDFILTGTATNFTDKFIKKNKNIFWWNDKSLLTCVREGDCEQSNLLQTESTVFRSSHRLLFGGFEFYEMIAPIGSTEHKLRKEITILEYDENKNDYVSVGSFGDSVEPKVKLDKPIIIEPNVKYAVIVEFEKNATLNWKCNQIKDDRSRKVSLQPDVQIEFREGFHSGYFSIISKLYFNRV